MAIQIRLTSKDKAELSTLTTLMLADNFSHIEVHPGDKIEILTLKITIGVVSLDEDKLRVVTEDGQMFFIDGYIAARAVDPSTALNFSGLDGAPTLVGSIADLLAILTPAAGNSGGGVDGPVPNDEGSSFGRLLILDEGGLTDRANFGQLPIFGEDGLTDRADRRERADNLLPLSPGEGSSGRESVRLAQSDVPTLFAPATGISADVDTAAPAANPADLAAASDSGSSNADNLTNAVRPTFTGMVEAGAGVEIFDGDPNAGGTSLGAATVTGTSWTFTAGADLSAGAHDIFTRVTDIAGNRTVSSALAVTVDTTAPTAPSITGADDNVGASQGNVLSGRATDDTTPTLTGTAEAGAVVTIFDTTAFGTVSIGTAVATGGTWSFTPTGNLDPGIHRFTTRQVDAAGNTSTASSAYTVTLIPMLGGAGTFRLVGEVVNYIADISVSSAGDWNHDGFDDLLVGLPFLNVSPFFNRDDGGAYVILGTAEGVSGSHSLSEVVDLNPANLNGLRILGEDSQTSMAGRSVSNAGDVNGDGFDDLIIGSPGFDITAMNDERGAAYVIFGTAAGLSRGHFLSEALDGVAVNLNGFSMVGGAGESAGYSVSAAGDVNGDGIDDMIVGAIGLGTGVGVAYVVFGTAAGLSGIHNLSEVLDNNPNNLNGFLLTPEAPGDRAGFSVSSAGDVNGDGIDDMIVGAIENSFFGAAYVIFGTANLSGSHSLSEVLDSITNMPATNLNGFRIAGFFGADNTGYSVSSIGDVNGDGIDDLSVGVNLHNSAVGLNAGAAYVIFGAATGVLLSGSHSLAEVVDSITDMPSTNLNGFRLTGEAGNDYAGTSVSNAGDINGDGIDDLLVGAHLSNSNALTDSGSVYVIFGVAGSLGGSYDLAAIGTSSLPGFRLTGQGTFDQTGISVSSAGDVNGDGFDDLIVGANLTNNSNIGAAYVVYGANFTGAVTQDLIAAGTLTGTGAVDVLNGSSGTDLLIGGGGVDVLLGGAGNDILAISDQTFRRIDGGSGIDTLRLDAGDLDLTQIANSRITSIERIDLATDSRTNALTLNASDLSHLSDGQAVTGVRNSIIITGTGVAGQNAGDDQVHLATTSLFQGVWVLNGTVNNLGDNVTYNRIEFRQFSSGGPTLGTLFVQQGVDVDALPPFSQVITSLVGPGPGNDPDGNATSLLDDTPSGDSPASFARLADDSSLSALAELKIAACQPDHDKMVSGNPLSLHDLLDAGQKEIAIGKPTSIGPPANFACNADLDLAMTGPTLLQETEHQVAA